MAETNDPVTAFKATCLFLFHWSLLGTYIFAVIGVVWSLVRVLVQHCCSRLPGGIYYGVSVGHEKKFETRWLKMSKCCYRKQGWVQRTWTRLKIKPWSRGHSEVRDENRESGTKSWQVWGLVRSLKSPYLLQRYLKQQGKWTETLWICSIGKQPNRKSFDNDRASEMMLRIQHGGCFEKYVRQKHLGLTGRWCRRFRQGRESESRSRVLVWSLWLWPEMKVGVRHWIRRHGISLILNMQNLRFKGSLFIQIWQPFKPEEV